MLGAANNFGNFNMPIYHIEFSDRETIVDKMKVMADERGISVEQLIKRFICDGMGQLIAASPEYLRRHLTISLLRMVH